MTDQKFEIVYEENDEEYSSTTIHAENFVDAVETFELCYPNKEMVSITRKDI